MLRPGREQLVEGVDLRARATRVTRVVKLALAADPALSLRIRALHHLERHNDTAGDAARRQGAGDGAPLAGFSTSKSSTNRSSTSSGEPVRRRIIESSELMPYRKT